MKWFRVKMRQRKPLTSLIGLAIWLTCICPACTLQASAQTFANRTYPEPTLTPSDQLLLDGLPAMHGAISSQLANTRWRLIMVVVQGHPYLNFDGQPALEFVNSSQYRGNDGCNLLSGVYHASSEGEFVQSGARTEKSCLKPNPAKTMLPYESDARFYAWFQQSRAFQVNGGELRLFFSDDHNDALIFTKNSAHLPSRRRFDYSNP